MSLIELSTTIKAPLDRVFDLARSIDLHVTGFDAGHHYPIDGVTTGLIGAGEQVAWRGRAFGLWWNHRSLIVDYNRPHHFRDTMIAGAFKSYDHDHFFDTSGDTTVMRDVVRFEAPAGILGRIVDRMLIHQYFCRLIEQRAISIREAAESDHWKKFIAE